MVLVILALFAAFVEIVRLRGRMEAAERRLERLDSARRETLFDEPPVARMPARIVERPAPAPMPEAAMPPIPETKAAFVAEPEPEPAPVPEKVPVFDKPEPAVPEPETIVAKPEPEPKTVKITTPDPVAPPRPRPTPVAAQGWSFDFEDLFGRRLPIWAGGITLAIAGVLIARYAIDLGILKIFTPTVRVICGLIFGLGLIGGAEAALRNEDRVDDPRVRQAMSGAGIATLYAAILVAANVYTLIDPLTAFIGLAAVTASALALSIRFGAPSAVLGLAGGLAAPAMVGAMQPNVPLLAVYLALTIAGLAGVSRMQRWPWLGILALAGGAGWSLWMVLASSALDTLGALSVGGYVLLLALGLPMLVADGPRATLLRTAAAVIGALQLALMVALGGFAMLNWGLFILLAAAAQWLALRDEGFGIVPSISLPLSALLLAIWPHPMLADFALVSSALALVHGGPLLWKLWRTPASVQRAIELSGLAAAILAVPFVHFWEPARDHSFALLAFGASLVPVAGMATGWARNDRQGDTRFAWLTATMGILVGAATLFAFAQWVWPIAIGTIGVALLFFAKPARDARIEPIAMAFATAAFGGLVYGSTLNGELLRLFVGNSGTIGDQTLLRWTSLTLVFALFAWRLTDAQPRTAYFGLCGFVAYGTLAQLLPEWPLSLALSAVAATMLVIARRRASDAEALLAGGFAIAAVPLLLLTQSPLGHEAQRLGGIDAAVSVFAALRWAGAALLALLFAVRSPSLSHRRVAQVGAALLGYGFAAQWLSPALLPLVAPVGIAALAAWSRREAGLRAPFAAATWLALTLAWALDPLALWAQDAAQSLLGVPMIVEAAAWPLDALLTRLLLPAALLGSALWLTRGLIQRVLMWVLAAIAGAFAIVSLHILYRLGFAGVAGTDFVATGIAQRLVWEATLIGIGALLARRPPSPPCRARLCHRWNAARALVWPVPSRSAVDRAGRRRRTTAEPDRATRRGSRCGHRCSASAPARMERRERRRGPARIDGRRRGVRLGAAPPDVPRQSADRTRRLSIGRHFALDPRDRARRRLPALGHPHAPPRLASRFAGADARRRRQGVPVRCFGARGASAHRFVRRARAQPHRYRLALQSPVEARRAARNQLINNLL